MHPISGSSGDNTVCATFCAAAVGDDRRGGSNGGHGAVAALHTLVAARSPPLGAPREECPTICFLSCDCGRRFGAEHRAGRRGRCLARRVFNGSCRGVRIERFTTQVRVKNDYGGV